MSERVAGAVAGRPMRRMEVEGAAIAYALLIMRGWEVTDTNHRILREHGRSSLIRVKKRAWQHVRSNRARALDALPPEHRPKEGA